MPKEHDMTQKLSTSESAPVIRQATAQDLASILDLVYQLAEYEKGLDKVTVTLTKYQDAFAEGRFQAFVAEVAGKIVGMAMYYMTFSSWKGRMMYLEDFIVLDDYRRQGIGKLLFEAFLDRAKEERSALCKWQVLRWNELAINFYKKYDTVFDDEWVDVKVYF